MFTSRQKKELRDKINKLSHTEHEEIFKILKNKELDYTQNKNGVFFDVSLLTNEIAQEIDQFVVFCMANKKELDDYDNQINECKMNNCFDKIKTSSVPLSKMIASDVVIDDWQGLIAENKSNERITAFVSLLESNVEKLVVKRGNTKFVNAKKKYSRKCISDKKNESDLQNTLEVEHYC